jgi:hypothetical protein
MSETKLLAQKRRKNLSAWMERNHVNLTELARRLQVGVAYTSLLLREEGRSFGEKAARSIEQKLHIPAGFLDSDGGIQMATDGWVAPSDVPQGMYGLVPQTRIMVGDKPGLIDVVALDLPPLAFKSSWLSGAGVRTKGGLVCGEQRDDSMAPYLGAGDVYMLDTDQVEVADGQVYALLYGRDIRLRRLSRRFDGGLILRADNARHPEEILSAEDAGRIKVVGRVVWRAG